ncbi:hexosaminidase D [Eurytemora carolleeae]|uniref:hexosaminidase D n=1 Tax=Eurytemora carolleeae TaxID=1294199 RepID=UPI000C7617C4|nr:hexosaminidase D [Eurytemora carolleeae]|eukprot:XP_023344088.1 hexosaminidase D-like [Eurytemora affinis]
MFIPNLNRHFNNQLSWLKVMERESGLAPSGKTIQFQGLLLAGWSRYDHFAVLCELLPVSIPSLVLDLVTVAKPVNLGAEIHSLLSCPGTVPLLTQRRLRQDPHQSELRNCKFPGSKLFGLVSSLQYYKSEAENLVRKLRLRGGWLTSYNLRHNFSSPSRLSPQTRQIQYLLKSLSEYSSNLNNEMNQFFLEDTVNEWIEQNILPIRVILQSLNKDINLISARKDWPRRPVVSSSVS